jgi:hypothetical protein
MHWRRSTPLKRGHAASAIAGCSARMDGLVPAVGRHPVWGWYLVVQELAHGRPMMRQTRSHRWGTLVPLPGCSCRRRHAEALMKPAEVIQTSAQPHPSGQDGLGVRNGVPPRPKGASDA